MPPSACFLMTPPPYTPPHPSIPVTTVFGGRSIHKKDKHKSTILFLVTGMHPPPPSYDLAFTCTSTVLYARLSLSLSDQIISWTHTLPTSTRHLAKHLLPQDRDTCISSTYTCNSYQTKQAFALQIMPMSSSSCNLGNINYEHVFLKFKEGTGEVDVKAGKTVYKVFKTLTTT